MKLPYWVNRSNSILSYWRLALGGTFLCTGLALAFVASSTMTTPVSAVSASPAGFYVSEIALARPSCAQTGDLMPPDGSQGEVAFAGQGDEPEGGRAAPPRPLVNRRLSTVPRTTP